MAWIIPGTDTTRGLLFDFDSHKRDLSWDEMLKVVACVMSELRKHGMVPIPFRSSGGHGVHVYVLWEEGQDAHSARELARGVLEAGGLKAGTNGVRDGEVEIFPKQDCVALNEYGSMFILPLTGESLPLNPETLDLEDYAYAEAKKEGPHSGSCAKARASSH